MFKSFINVLNDRIINANLILSINKFSTFTYQKQNINKFGKLDMSVLDNYIKRIQDCVPVLNSQLYKGNCGRLGTIGGCTEYTGAPYFAAITMLKMGADLSHVFCTENAASVIKSYSPELIVHPILDSNEIKEEMIKWCPKLDVVLIGPGLGRDRRLLSAVKEIVELLKEMKKPMVIDADGVHCISQHLNLIKGYKNIILTPNVAEFKHLFSKVHGKELNGLSSEEAVKMTCQSLGGVTIVRKGPEDIISNGETIILCKEIGSPRRCGGQGDLLAGSIALFFNWILAKKKIDIPASILASYGGCFLTRKCSNKGFETFGRSMTTSDMISCIHKVFLKTFENNITDV